MGQTIDNIKHAYSTKESYIITLIGTLLIGYVFFKFTYLEQLWWNLGPIYTITQVVLQVLISLFFGINAALLWHKLKFVANNNGRTGKEAGSTVLGSVISVIVSGCPACGITLASYLGIATFFTAFPLYGLELKFVGVGLLLYSTNKLAKDMYVCKLEPHKT